MINPKPFHILLVHPPVASPAIPPWIMASAASYIASPGVYLEKYDANLDFFLDNILNPKILRYCMERVEKKVKTDELRGLSPLEGIGVEGITLHPEHWGDKINGINHSLECLMSNLFYRPEIYTSAIKNISDMLALTSLAFYPSIIRWGHFSNPCVKNWKNVAGFVENTTTNPFLGMCERGLSRKLAKRSLNLLLLFVPTTDQVLAALTMAHFTKKKRPDLPITIVGDTSLLKGATGYGDNLIPSTDMKGLLKLIERMGDLKLQEGESIPDYNGLPLKDYLAPELILPLRLPGDSEKSLSQPSTLWDSMTKQVKTFGAAGFLSQDTRINTASLRSVSGYAYEGHAPLYLGLNCILDSPNEIKDMTPVYKMGVKCIQWDGFAGESKHLIKALWQTSKAGIWNHVVIKRGPHTKVNHAFISFIEANPNIAHSWVNRKTINLPFLDSYEDVPGGKSAYSKVADLPGKPFWQWMTEAVYMLLYLNRYDSRNVIYWRVDDSSKYVHTLGSSMEYHFVKPKELPPGYLDEICRMVEAGESVGPEWVRYNLERAFLIGYVTERGVIVANSSLKHPRIEYVQAVGKQTGLDLNQFLERGYTSVRPEYRGMGIGTKLLEGLTARVGDKKLFSIIAEDNTATKKIALRNKTRQVARFYSEKLGKEIGVWIPEWMIEDTSVH